MMEVQMLAVLFFSFFRALITDGMMIMGKFDNPGSRMCIAHVRYVS